MNIFSSLQLLSIFLFHVSVAFHEMTCTEVGRCRESCSKSTESSLYCTSLRHIRFYIDKVIFIRSSHEQAKNTLRQSSKALS